MLRLAGSRSEIGRVVRKRVGADAQRSARPETSWNASSEGEACFLKSLRSYLQLERWASQAARRAGEARGRPN